MVDGSTRVFVASSLGVQLHYCVVLSLRMKAGRWEGYRVLIKLEYSLRISPKDCSRTSSTIVMKF